MIVKHEHTFAICAYKESVFLEECILSLKRQTIESEIILVTSTPCTFIFDLCSKYDIKYYINEGDAGITQDWNFAYAKSSTPIVTITHQDDIYFQNYTEKLLDIYKKSKKPLIFFSDYYEIRDKKIIKENRLLKIKRFMLLPMRIQAFQSNIFVRRRILSIGSPICCPSVAFFKKNLPEVIFNNHFRTNEDWEAWEMISKMKGQFLYVKTPLMAHRIHEDSETSAVIQATGRTEEDMQMYRKFWPECIAKILCKLYKKSEESNKI